MHPLHDYFAKQLAEHLKSKRVVVWYDLRRDFAPFIEELRGSASRARIPVNVSVAGTAARLAEYAGSFFELRAMVEPFVAGDEVEPLVVYVPGLDPDKLGSVLMELEKAGKCYQPDLKQRARNVLEKKYTLGQIDEIISRPNLTYEDLSHVAADTHGGEAPSILKAVFPEERGNDALLAAWLVRDARDGDIQAKEATGEIVKLVRVRLGLELPTDAPPAKLRALALRYVLGGEFRLDLRCAPPACLDGLPAPKLKDHETAVRELARRLRSDHLDDYPAIADRVQEELGLAAATIAPRDLGSIDTFRFEEHALLRHSGELIASQRFDEALAIVGEREQSFWLDRDLGRKAQWEACRRMAELGAVAVAIRSELPKVAADPAGWIERYSDRSGSTDSSQDGFGEGWYRLDQAQRRLEAWVANLEDEAEEKPLGVVRRAYEDTCHAMAAGFSKALVKANWVVSGALHQTRIWSEVVAARPKPVAYFLVDAMRFEMGVELSLRLPKTAEVSLRPAMVALPSITPIGMAALLPGASSTFSAVAQNDKLGVLIEDSFLPDVSARRKFASSRVPGLIDMTLDELLGLPPSKVAMKVDAAQVVIVRSQEIDHAGEAGFTFQARQVMDTVIDNLARAIRKLAGAGVEHAVVAADHGHLCFPVDREEAMRIDSPKGHEVELHRRCWIGRGGVTPPGCARVTAAALGYASDLEFVFPIGAGVFKAGGDLAFHHGGLSLQEVVVPVLTIRLKARQEKQATTSPIVVAGAPDAVTNRIFSVTIQLGGQNLSLFAAPMVVRPLLMAGGKQVGDAGMAIDAELDRATGCVTLQPGKPATIAFRLKDESATSLRVVVQDPATDADLYRSATDIPVRLGV